MKTSDFPSVREARLTVEKHMERYKKLMGIKKGKTMIELPRLNSVSVMTSTELIASLRAESDELIKYQFSHTKEAMSCLQRLHDLSLEAADALQALERVPMTEQQAAKMARNMHTWPEKIEEVIRATEAHHGITPPESI